MEKKFQIGDWIIGSGDYVPLIAKQILEIRDEGQYVRYYDKECPGDVDIANNGTEIIFLRLATPQEIETSKQTNPS